MRRSVVSVVVGLLLACGLAAFLGLAFRVPLAEWRITESPLRFITRAVLPIAAFSLPFALAAIGLSEARRVRGLPYWMFVGALIGILGFVAASGGPPDTRPAYQNMHTLFALAGMGLAAGFVYWWVAGRHAGRIAADLARASSGHMSDEHATRRCWGCVLAGIALSLVPLALLGWYSIYRPAPMLADSLVSRAEAEASSLLAKGGVPALSLKVTDYVGHVMGQSATSDQRRKDFEIAKVALAPMVGLPGIVAYIENDIAIADAKSDAAGVAPIANAEDAVKRQLEADVTAKAAAQKVAEAAAATRAAEEAGVAAADAAKRKSEEIVRAAEALAKAKADADDRVAQEAEAKRRMDEVTARVAAEATAREKAESDKAQAEARAAEAEEAARVKAETDRLAAEATARAQAEMAAEVRRKAETEARASAEAAERAEAERVARAKAEAERLAAELEAKRKAADELQARAARDREVEEARRVAEAEAERKAVDAAHAEAAAAAAKDAEAKAVAAGEAQCAGTFSDLFRANTIRFKALSVAVAPEAKGYLDAIADAAKKCPSYALSIGGHTDRVGSAASNMALSQARADGVRDALIARGIDAARLSAAGYGGERPFDPANSPAAYALNRRVDFGAAPAVTKPVAKVATVVAKAEPQPAETSVPHSDLAAVVPAANKMEVAPAECAGEFSRLFLSDTIRFRGASAQLAPIFNGYLDRLASLLGACANYKLAIGGHTDRRGSEAANQRLSAARAERVKTALVARGLAANRLSAQGYAGQRPFDPGSSREAFALNRRVDFGISELPK